MYSKLEYQKFIRKYLLIKRLCRRVKDLYDGIIFTMYSIYLYNYDVQLAKTYDENNNIQQPTDSYILGLMKDVINNSKIRID